MAAKSGGIITNIKRPAEFFYENVVMNTHMLHDAQQAGVKKFVTFMGGCSYPSDARSPIDESQMWAGYPQIESAGYSVAKKMLLTQSWAYRVQHGFNSIVLSPGNVYGEWDNFNLEEAHVIPARIRKYMEAQERQAPPSRHSAPANPPAILSMPGMSWPPSLGLFKIITAANPSTSPRAASFHSRAGRNRQKVTGFAGEIVWDATKPDGQMDKIFDVTRLHSLGLSCDTSLEDGLRRTTDWFRQARERGEVRL